MTSDLRLVALQSWLATRLGGRAFTLASASADASFRRYFRASFEDGGESLVAMDAPPDKEDCRPFLHVARLFQAAGAHVPAVIDENLADGFLLLEDLGNTTYLDRLEAGGARDEVAGELYAAAIDTLVAIQSASRPGQLPRYDEALLRRELGLFPDWYLARHLALEPAHKDAQLLAEAFDRIVANNLAQPQVYVHRDYHSRNLMVCKPLPGVIDFQDAVHGPITYDLVSLLKDAYVRWDEARVIDWCVRYWEKARTAGLPVHGDFADFYRDFEWMGVQRHLKVAGIFARLAHRDGKERYLSDIPLVLDYLQRACARYRELGPLADLLDRLHERTPQTGYTF
ncbi:MAG: phosphotransferase [Proteobacteria bacterium]|nr:phosphotransferase [Pseudomonadota bacterium]